MTGNYDMLKLDDPGKGDDRRIKIGDVSDELKSVEYCNTLDDYLDDEDVQYAMFWYCIDNHKPNWNELQDLKNCQCLKLNRIWFNNHLTVVHYS